MILKPVDQPDQIYNKTNSSNYTGIDQSSGKLADELPEALLNYIAGLGHGAESGLLVLPHRNHYFYDFEELKRVRTIVNLMKLNHVRDLRGFIRKLSELLHYQANFIGCFVDDTTQNRFSGKYNNPSKMDSEMPESYENGIESRIPFVNRIYSIIDAKTNRYLTRRMVTNLLNEFGFQVVIMTELNGVTWFHSKKLSSGVEHSSPERQHSLSGKEIPS